MPETAHPTKQGVKRAGRVHEGAKGVDLCADSLRRGFGLGNHGGKIAMIGRGQNLETRASTPPEFWLPVMKKRGFQARGRQEGKAPEGDYPICGSIVI